MHQLRKIGAELRRPDPHAERAERDREGRQGDQTVLQQEFEIGRVGRIAPQPDAERIKDRVALPIALPLLGKDMREEKIGPKRHRHTGSQVKISPERLSG